MKHALTLAFFLIAASINGIDSAAGQITLSTRAGIKDSVERQILFNGRVWRNQYYNIEGHQFLYSSQYLPGSVKIDEYTFDSIRLKYDIFNDELLILRSDGVVIQLNKEMISSFSLGFNNDLLHFVNFDNNPEGPVKGYFNILYDSGIKIYIKYLKEIMPTTITNGPPKFNQSSKIYIIKGGQIHRTDTRKDLISLFAEGEEQSMIKKYIRSNQIKISRNDPEGFRRVIEYYETVTK